MANEMVKVRLVKPYSGSKDGSLRIKMGETPSRPLSGQSMVQLASVNEMGEVIYPQQRNFIPGKEVYAKNAAGEDKLFAEGGRDTTVIPMEWAKLYFGNWDAPEELPIGADPNRTATWSSEREDVATRWGYYKYKPQNSSDTTIYSFDTTPVGPPDMPYVELTIMDGAGNATGKVIDPRDYYHFNDKDEFPKYDFKKSPAKVVK